MLSLNEPADGGGGGGRDTGVGVGLEEQSQDSRDVIYRWESYLDNTPTTYKADGVAVQDQSWKKKKRTEPGCWRMQPAFSPLCVVSARITTVDEEEEEREEDGQRERCIQPDVPLLSYKTGPVGFAPCMLPRML